MKTKTRLLILKNNLIILFTMVLFFLIFISYNNNYLSKILKTEDQKFLINELQKWEKSEKTEKHFYIGIIIHTLATLGNYNFIEEGIKSLSIYYEKTNSPIALAYKGSLYTLQASQYSKNGQLIEALDLLKKGTMLIDDAVKLDPKNIDLRFLRINNGLGISESSPVKRFDVIKDDLNFIFTKLKILPKNLKAEYFYLLGYYNYLIEDIDNAIKNFEIVCKKYNDTEYCKLAKEILFELEE